MAKYHICHICGETMYPTLESEEYAFDGIKIVVDDVRVFRCTRCGEGILESEEAKRIEKIILERTNKNK